MPFNIKINDDVDELRDAVRKFAEGEIAPLADETDLKKEFPNQLRKKFGDKGILRDKHHRKIWRYWFKLPITPCCDGGDF